MLCTSKNDGAASNQPLLDLRDNWTQNPELCTDMSDGEFCFFQSYPNSAVKIQTIDDAASNNREMEVGARSGDSIYDGSVQAKRSGRTKYLFVESYNSQTTNMRAADSFLGPGKVGILNSDRDDYPIFVRPIVSSEIGSPLQIPH